MLTCSHLLAYIIKDLCSMLVYILIGTATLDTGFLTTGPQTD